MEIKAVGNRGLLFTFKEMNCEPYHCVTNVYVINSKDKYFICDTYLGEYYMKKVLKYVEVNYGKKDIVVFNSHSHWDHIWGNSIFSNSMIIAHEKCRDEIINCGEAELENNKEQFAKEKITLIPPTITFTNNIKFEEEGVGFFYSPGHSEDSASCIDYIDNVLFVGDNVNDPIPTYMCWKEVDKYIDTLKSYLTINADVVVHSHGDVINNEIIEKNIEYLTMIKDGKKDFSLEEENMRDHKINLELFS